MSSNASRRRDGTKGRESGPASGGKAPRRKGANRTLVIVALLAVLAAVVIFAMYGNTSVAKLQVAKGDQLQYSISGYESGKAVSGALSMTVNSTTSSSFTVTYAITIGNNTTRNDVKFDGASGGWSANVDDVVGRLSGSDAQATAGNTTTFSTAYGTKELVGYSISSTSQSGIGILFQYWVDSTTRCPYLMSMTYANGDVLSFTLVYTNISAFL